MHSRPREAFELLEEESPMEKLRPSDDWPRVAGEDLYHIDEELSPVAEEVDEAGKKKEISKKEEDELNGPE